MRKSIFIFVLTSVSVLAMISGARAVDSTRYDGSPADTAKWSISGGDQQNPTTIYLYDTDMNIDSNYFGTHGFIRLEELQNDLGAGSSGRTYDSCVLQLVLTTINNLTDDDTLCVYAKDITIGTWNQDSTSWDSATQNIPWTTGGGDFGSIVSDDTIYVDAASAVNDTFRLHLDTGFVRSMIEVNNFGFGLIGVNINDNNAIVYFGANQNSTAAKRPVFTVYYHTTAAEPAKPGRRRRLLQ